MTNPKHQASGPTPEPPELTTTTDAEWLSVSPVDGDTEHAVICRAAIAAYYERHGTRRQGIRARAALREATANHRERLEVEHDRVVEVAVDEIAPENLPPSKVVKVWEAEIEERRGFYAYTAAATLHEQCAEPGGPRTVVMMVGSVMVTARRGDPDALPELLRRARSARRRATTLRRRAAGIRRAAMRAACPTKVIDATRVQRPRARESASTGASKGAKRASSRSRDKPGPGSDDPGGEDPPRAAGEHAELPTGPGTPCRYCQEPIPDFKPGATRRTPSHAKTCCETHAKYLRDGREKPSDRLPPGPAGHPGRAEEPESWHRLGDKRRPARIFRPSLIPEGVDDEVAIVFLEESAGRAWGGRRVAA